MPRIPVFTANRNVPVAFLPRASAEAFGSEIGASLKDLGKSLGDAGNVLGDVLERQRKQDEEIRILEGIAGVRDEVAIHGEQSREPGAPDGQGFTESALDNVDRVASEWARRLPPHLHGRLASDLAVVADEVTEKGLRLQFQRQAELRRDRLSQAIDRNANTIARDPSQHDAIFARTGETVENLGLSPPQTQRIIDFVRNRYSVAAVRGASPRDALALLTSGELTDSFAPGVEEKLLNEVQASFEREEREAQIEATVGRSREVFRLLTEINRDEATHADVERLDAEVGLSGGERDRLTTAADRRLEARRQEATDIAVVNDALTGGRPLDPNNPAHRRAVDRHYRRTVQAWAELSPEELNARIAAYVGQVGFVPETVLEATRAYSHVGTPEQRAAAVDLVTRMLDANPAVLDDFRAGEVEALLLVDGSSGARESQQGPGQASPLLIPAAAPALAVLPLLFGGGAVQSLLRMAPMLAPLLLRGDKAQQEGDDGEQDEPKGPQPDKSGAVQQPSEEPPELPTPDPSLTPRPREKPRNAEENSRLGTAAVDIVMTTKGSVRHAMYRSDTGWITFDYGRPGDGPPDFRRGFGLSHIVAKHGEETLRLLPEAIANGVMAEVSGPPNALRMVIETRNMRVIISLFRDLQSESWVLTAFDPTTEAPR